MNIDLKLIGKKIKQVNGNCIYLILQRKSYKYKNYLKIFITMFKNAPDKTLWTKSIASNPKNFKNTCIILVANKTL